MKSTQEFLDRFNRWKNGAPILELYEAGRPVKFYKGKDTNELPEEDSALRAALRAAIDYKLSLDYDTYNEGKDTEEPKAVAGGYNFNAIHKVALNAPLSYGSYYDLTGDVNMDNRLPKYKKGKGSYKDATDFITHYEGFKDTVYQNEGDVKTVGYGTTAKKWIDYANKRGRITKAEGRKAMNEHLSDTVIPLLRKRIPGYDTMPEQALWVLQDILYNVGEGNLFDLSPNFMRAIKNKDWAEAARQMDWDNNKKGYETGARDRNAERARLWNLAWNLKPVPATIVEALEQNPVRQFIPQPVDPYVAPLSPSKAAYNPNVPASINKDTGVTTWPRYTVLPDIKELSDAILNDKLPLQQPLRSWIAQ